MHCTSVGSVCFWCCISHESCESFCLTFHSIKPIQAPVVLNLTLHALPQMTEAAEYDNVGRIRRMATFILQIDTIPATGETVNVHCDITRVELNDEQECNRAYYPETDALVDPIENYLDPRQMKRVMKNLGLPCSFVSTKKKDKVKRSKRRVLDLPLPEITCFPQEYMDSAYETFWQQEGYGIIWHNWQEQYKDYIDPGYSNGEELKMVEENLVTSNADVLVGINPEETEKPVPGSGDGDEAAVDGNAVKNVEYQEAGKGVSEAGNEYKDEWNATWEKFSADQYELYYSGFLCHFFEVWTGHFDTIERHSAMRSLLLSLPSAGETCDGKSSKSLNSGGESANTSPDFEKLKAQLLYDFTPTPVIDEKPVQPSCKEEPTSNKNKVPDEMDSNMVNEEDESPDELPLITSKHRLQVEEMQESSLTSLNSDEQLPTAASLKNDDSDEGEIEDESPDQLALSTSKRKFRFDEEGAAGLKTIYKIAKNLGLCVQTGKPEIVDEMTIVGGKVEFCHKNVQKEMKHDRRKKSKHIRFNEEDKEQTNESDLISDDTVAVSEEVCMEEKNDLMEQIPKTKLDLKDHFLYKSGSDSFLVFNAKKDPSLIKYYNQRFRLFSKFDKGIKLDKESWFSVTPEAIAKHIAEQCVCDVVIDGFCGAGGNTIQLALVCKKVIAIDTDPNKIKLAKHNAVIYGVRHKIDFILGNYMQLAPNLKADVVFLSPPWGGIDYLKDQVFDLKSMPIDGFKIMEVTRLITKDVAFFLPKNCDMDQVVVLAAPAGKVRIEQNILNRKCKSVTAYYGNLVNV